MEVSCDIRDGRTADEQEIEIRFPTNAVAVSGEELDWKQLQVQSRSHGQIVQTHSESDLFASPPSTAGNLRQFAATRTRQRTTAFSSTVTGFNDRGRIKAVTVKGLRGFVGNAFVNSVIASSKIDRVRIQSIQTGNVTTWFGLLASADDGQRIKSVVTSDPDHKWDPLLLDDDFVGDFHVQMIANPS